jgi:hypothetical protein
VAGHALPDHVVLGDCDARAPAPGPLDSQLHRREIYNVLIVSQFCAH